MGRLYENPAKKRLTGGVAIQNCRVQIEVRPEPVEGRPTLECQPRFDRLSANG
jgi:hypothetical protein